jgi:hypothetical protein
MTRKFTTGKGVLLYLKRKECLMRLGSARLLVIRPPESVLIEYSAHVHGKGNFNIDSGFGRELWSVRRWDSTVGEIGVAYLNFKFSGIEIAI